MQRFDYGMSTRGIGHWSRGSSPLSVGRTAIHGSVLGQLNQHRATHGQAGELSVSDSSEKARNGALLLSLLRPQDDQHPSDSRQHPLRHPLLPLYGGELT